MLACGTDVDVRAASIAVLEQRETFEHRGGGDAVQTREHPSVAQDTDIVERRLYGSKHIANYGFGPVHRITCEMSFVNRRGAGEGRGSPCFNRRGHAYYRRFSSTEGGLATSFTVPG